MCPIPDNMGLIASVEGVNLAPKPSGEEKWVLNRSGVLGLGPYCRLR
jgi:hypothetical protein